MSAAAVSADAAPVERTKYKALLSWFHMQAAAMEGKEVEEVPLEATLAKSLVKVADVNPLTPTRPDRRFPNTNQANNCWTAFNEYQLCVEKRGVRDALCLQRGRDYSSICPEKWVSTYKDHIDAGTSMSIGTAFVKAE